MDRTRRRLLLSLLVLAVIATGCSPGGDKVDSRFDTDVAAPAYADDGPRVLFDEAHHNWHTAGKSYRPFVEMIESDGYHVARNKERVTAETLAPYAVFIVANAVGTNDRNDAPAFEETECDAIRDWVAGGGSLLLIVDHYPTGHAVEALAQRLGVVLSKGVAEDSVHSEPSFDSSHIVFSHDNGGLAAHPVVDGRDSHERVNRVLTFTGQALFADAPAVGFLRLSDTAVARNAHPVVEKRGGDTIVSVTYGAPEPAHGWAQGLALEFGKGRVVVLGEAAMLSARLHRYDGRPVGMNTAGYDNRQLALNIMHWLTRLS